MPDRLCGSAHKVSELGGRQAEHTKQWAPKIGIKGQLLLLWAVVSSRRRTNDEGLSCDCSTSWTGRGSKWNGGEQKQPSSPLRPQLSVAGSMQGWQSLVLFCWDSLSESAAAVAFSTDVTIQLSTLRALQELEFIHKSSSTVGYRPNVFSTTLSHLIATNCPQLIVPLVPIREKLKEKVEEFFGCEYELCIEFTGLIRLGSSIRLSIVFLCFRSDYSAVSSFFFICFCSKIMAAVNLLRHANMRISMISGDNKSCWC